MKNEIYGVCYVYKSPEINKKKKKEERNKKDNATVLYFRQSFDGDIKYINFCMPIQLLW